MSTIPPFEWPDDWTETPPQTPAQKPNGAHKSVDVQPETAEKPPRTPIKWRELVGKTPPERQWIINHWLTAGPTLLAGQGGIGKTLLAQTIATAIALGKPYIDTIAEPKRVLFWACEDDHDELWRRQLAICGMFDCSLEDLDGKLIIEPRSGQENGLLLPNFGQPTWTPLRQELREQVNDYQAQVLMMDNIGQCFGGNENDRHHVTAFLSGLIGLSTEPLAILILGHPAKSINSEYSGSTAWEAAVRMRWYLGKRLPDAKSDDDDVEDDESVRYLCKRKANYSRLDYRQLSYLNGAYHCADPSENGPTFRDKYGSHNREEMAQKLVMAAVHQFFSQGVRLTSGPNSPDYFVTKMREIQITQDYTEKELRKALTQLQVVGRVSEKPIGGVYANRARKMGLAPSDLELHTMR